MNARVDGEGFSQRAVVENLACRWFKSYPDQLDDLPRDAIVGQQLPQCVSIHAIEGLFKAHKDVYKVVFHSRLCSIILRSVAIGSVVNRSCQKPACLSCNTCSFYTSVLFLSSGILLKTFPGINKSDSSPVRAFFEVPLLG